MPKQIWPISLPLPFRMGSVNCYLLETRTGFVLIDSGAPNNGPQLARTLAEAGCRPGGLALIILTHGDFDHAGNAASLREEFGANIALHRDDLGMVERGDMFFNRSSGSAILRWFAPLLFRFGKSKRFAPDLFLQEGDDLAEYGLDARVIELPGHSQGSIGVVTAGGDLFCGDLLANDGKPALGAIMDDEVAARASLAKLEGLGIQTVYPGHGSPFLLEQLVEGA